MLLFSIATLLPVVLLALSALVGGVWVWLAVGYITVFTYTLDRFVRPFVPLRDPESEFPAGETLSLVLAFAHFVLLWLAIFAIGGTDGLTPLEKFGAIIAFGLFFGQVSNPNAHELIHKSSRPLRALGKAVYISLLFGHHASAHPRVHHIHVATDADPNSARFGEGFWRFSARAWRGSFRAGLKAETALRARANTPPPRYSHPYVAYTFGASLTVIVSFLINDLSGILALLAVAAYAQIQLLLSDYVQHYGLRRALRDDGRPIPVGPQHSWNTPHWYSSAVMLNAPRHSDHHMNPARPYPALELNPETMPILPHSLPVMAVIALVPPLWRRIMDPRVALWNDTGNTPPSAAP